LSQSGGALHGPDRRELARLGLGFHGVSRLPVVTGDGADRLRFGLRHAVDADQIAAIGNVTRKLMQEGERPITVGFFFSPGHSTVVTAAALQIALTASNPQRSFPGLIEAGGLIGTLVSVIFLFAIALINLVVLIGVFRVFRRANRGEDYAEDELNVPLARRGCSAGCSEACSDQFARS
jgi:nickel/cobalt transporter (NiCoT) family protein